MTDIITTSSIPEVIATETQEAHVIEGPPQSPGLVITEADGSSSTIVTTVQGGTILQTAPATATTLTVSAVGPQGPPGPMGIPGAGTTYLAGEILSGHRAVRIDDGAAFYADHQTTLQKDSISGITLQAATAGSQVVICEFGPVVEPAWSWTPGRTIWLGVNGQLTQTRPTTGFVIRLGYAQTPTRMHVEIGLPIVLA